MALKITVNGGPYVVPADSAMPTANEVVGARYQGRKIAEIASKLHS